jgi:hypothetical protein
MKKSIHIKKSSGFDAEFSRKKLEKSLMVAGADRKIASSIATQIESEIRPGMNTYDIYSLALAYLKSRTRAPIAAKYSLKRAIADLGPTGFPFEHFVSEIMKYNGFETHVSAIVQGECVQHEVDILAYRESVTCFVECKFHNNAGYNTDVKIPLYIQSRFLDIKAEFEKNETGRSYEGWVVTNTRFSNDAIRYGECKGLKLIGWTYPSVGNLNQLIEESGLHPVTCLTTINDNVKTGLLKNNIVLCQQAIERSDLLKQLGMSDSAISVTIEEIRGVCNM